MSLKRKMQRRREAALQPLEIVREAMPPAQPLSSELRAALPALRELVHEDPGAAVRELRAWIEREPVPMLFNWLSAAYSGLGDLDAVGELVRENYRRNPGYLFARVNYAEQCIGKGDLAGAREALGQNFDLRRLLRGRKRVHISELTGYFYAVGLYHYKAGDRQAAEEAYEVLEHTAPDEAPTRKLGSLLHPRLRDLFFR